MKMFTTEELNNIYRTTDLKLLTEEDLRDLEKTTLATLESAEQENYNAKELQKNAIIYMIYHSEQFNLFLKKKICTEDHFPYLEEIMNDKSLKDYEKYEMIESEKTELAQHIKLDLVDYMNNHYDNFDNGDYLDLMDYLSFELPLLFDKDIEICRDYWKLRNVDNEVYHKTKIKLLEMRKASADYMKGRNKELALAKTLYDLRNEIKLIKEVLKDYDNSRD